MKWLIGFLWATIIVAFVVFAVPSLRQNVSDFFSYSLCSEPLEYKLGTIDARFGLTRQEALVDIEDATKIWSDTRGQNLFANSHDAKLTVNFIYDRRQALNIKINELNNEVSQKNAQLKTMIDQYKKDSTDFERRINDFMNTVNKYNSEGGAPEEAYNDLINKQSQLKVEGDSLNARAKQLNLSTVDYNSNVSVLNNDIGQFKEELKKKPEEGLYDGGNNTITIYFADNHDELVHTLAHEFGHALGMDHVSDRDAIMYPNTTGTLTPTTLDLKQLNYVCRKQSAPLHWVREFNEWIYLKVENLGKSFSFRMDQYASLT